MKFYATVQTNKAVTHDCIKKSLCHIKHTANGKIYVQNDTYFNT